MRDLNSRNQSRLNRQFHMRAALLKGFVENDLGSLRDFDPKKKDWDKVRQWLHTSGIALYFYDRLASLEMLHLLPRELDRNLHESLAQNEERSKALLDDAITVNHHFQQRGLQYANLKGFTLWPDSVSRLALRSQLDLDFLIHPENADEATCLLQQLGYVLHAKSGKSLEFKKNANQPPSLRDLYKAIPYRSLELHVEPVESERMRTLVTREIGGCAMPSLAPVPLYINQALHLSRHIRRGFTRLSWFVELRRHTLARHHDASFQQNLIAAISTNQGTCASMAVAFHVAHHLLDDFTPQALLLSNKLNLSGGVQLWIERYGYRALLADFPGTKLHLLLESEVQRMTVGKQKRVQPLLPRSLPPMIEPTPARECLSQRLIRYQRQARFICFRLRFHLVEGLRFLYASSRWRQLRSESSR